MEDDGFKKAVHFVPTTDPGMLQEADYLIIAVPTPIDGARRPDLTLLESASRTVGQNKKKGAVVIFESTVYPGATEEVWKPHGS